MKTLRQSVLNISNGYKLKKCIGFDEDAFKKDYPQIWAKYLIYENV